MGALVFTLDTETFSWTVGRDFPIHDPSRVYVPTAMTESGQLYAYNKGIQEKLFYLKFTNAPAADFENFEDWLLTVAVGPLNAFTFTDENEDDHTVRLMDTENPLKENSLGMYSGTITLRKEIT